MPSRFTLLIAGGSGSGKTTLARGLAERLAGAIVLPIDAYYRDLSHLPFERRSETNFDDPGAIELDLLLEQLAALRRGESVQRPVYDFAEHTRRRESLDLQAHGPIVVEGLHALYWAGLREQADASVFLQAPQELRRRRRLARDVCERGRDAAFAERQFDASVAPAHARLIEPAARFADLTLDAAAPPHELLEQTLEALNRMKLYSVD